MKVLAALPLLLCVACDAQAHFQEPAPKPSMILFVVDTLRADHLGVYGYERDTSPRLDAFAAEAVTFERCLAQSTWTKPSTASIHTGRYPSEHGATAIQTIIDPSVGTIAEALRDAGYDTAAFVTNGMVSGGAVGFDRGFTEFNAYQEGKGKLGYVRAGPVVDDALAWLDARTSDEPFFLYVHLLDPHAPYDPPSPFDVRFGESLAGSIDGYSVMDGLNPKQLNRDDIQHLIDLYDGEIAYTDEQFGRFLDGLDERKVLDDTGIVFVSDHGEEFLDHGGLQHGPGMFEEVVRVPLICRFPQWSKSALGRTSELLAQQIDILPTIQHAAGLERTPGLPGRSLLVEALTTDSGPTFGFSEVEQNGVVRRGVIHDGWKYVRTFSPEDNERLHELSSDPGERENILTEAPERASLLRTKLTTQARSLRTGYTLEVRNDGGTVADVLVAATTARLPIERIRLLLAEDEPKSSLKDLDGPIQWELLVGGNDSGYLTRVYLKTAPGDRDGVSFTLDENESSCSLVVFVGDAPIPVHLGARGQDGGLRIQLDPTSDEHLLAFERPTTTEGASGLTAYLWKNPGVSTRETDLEEAVMEQLEALGYTD